MYYFVSYTNYYCVLNCFVYKLLLCITLFCIQTSIVYYFVLYTNFYCVLLCFVYKLLLCITLFRIQTTIVMDYYCKGIIFVCKLFIEGKNSKEKNNVSASKPLFCMKFLCILTTFVYKDPLYINHFCI